MQFKEFGPSPSGVLWKNAKGQEQRFETLLGICKETAAEKIAINDLGCGYGALFEFLKNHNFNQGHFTYQGFDICREMIVDCNQRVADDRASFTWTYQAEMLADYTFMSGTFNMKGTAEDDQWLSYIQDSLRLVDKNSRKGFAFNLHDVAQKKRLEWTFYAEPEVMLKFCQKSFSGEVSMIKDKKKKEFSILVQK